MMVFLLFCSCRCQIKVNVEHNITVTYNVTNLKLDDVTNHWNSSSDVMMQGRHRCVSQRRTCKHTCAKHLDLDAHLQHFTPLGLVLCSHAHTPTPPGGVVVYALATMTSGACAHHHRPMTPQLRQVRGSRRLCCDWTTLMDESGESMSRFGWNPDCQQQIFYLE